ncbi:hypothetical protein BFO01nite_48350 [Brevibacillus formosus]|uniref:Uncharacterized protein n=1 Tax=Brevibacillus formosus TaxID=54913 RepID=A0ABQ0TBP4_9BACL|nr:hypothetical protein BFO01nite_48350 [Brevibacillus formosus]
MSSQILGKQFAIPLHYYGFKLSKIELIEFLGDLGVWEDFSGGGIVDQRDSHYRRKSQYHKNLKKYLLKNN